MEDTYNTFLKGMTCLSCVDIILNKMFSLKGIINVDISYFKSSINIKYDPSIITKEEIETVLLNIGYPPSDKKENNLLYEIITIVLIILLLLILEFIKLPSVPKVEKGASILFLFLTGLLTGTHCICMCSGIMFAVIGDNDKRALLKYQFGRLLMCTILGLLFGSIGNVFAYSLKLKSFIYTVCGLFILFIGICKWGIIPSFRRLEATIPKLCPFKLNNYLKTNKAFIVGVLNALFPCGMSSIMWLYCATCGSVFESGLSMFFWCLGTIVIMCIFSITNKLFNSRQNIIFQRFSTILMVTMGLRMLVNGIKLF